MAEEAIAFLPNKFLIDGKTDVDDQKNDCSFT